MTEEMKYLDAVIDCSHHNTITDFNAIKESGIIGMIHKATNGTSGVDRKYFARKKGCEEAGLLFGAYHFGTGGNVKAQVDNFLSIVKPDENPNTLMVLDYEDNTLGTDMAYQMACDFVQEVFDRTGKWIGIYSGAKLKADLQTYDLGVLENCWLWISHYTTKAKLKYPKEFKRLTMWQYTDRGQVPGISYNVDKNYFNGDECGLKRLWGVS